MNLNANGKEVEVQLESIKAQQTPLKDQALHDSPGHAVGIPSWPGVRFRDERNRAHKKRTNPNESGRIWTKPKPQTKPLFS